MIVEITKNGKTLRVPSKAYESQYKASGWVRVGENKMNDCGESWNTDALSNINTNKGKEGLPGEPELNQDETWEDEEWEDETEEATDKSYDEMSLDELTKVAKSKGLDTTKLKTVGELKKALKTLK